MLKNNVRIEKIGIVLIFVAGLVPLTWLQPDAIIAKGDSFPFWLDPNSTLHMDSYLWSFQHMGRPNTFSSYLIYELVWLFLRSMGLSVGLVQAFFQVFFFMGSGLFMYKLARTIYPQLTFAPIISGIFYMFNFFVLEINIFNVGISWTYTFIPLLLMLLITIIKNVNQNNPQTLNKTILYFAAVSSITFSFASQNPANIALILLVLAVMFLYYILVQRKAGHKLFTSTVSLIIITVLLNLWWVVPVFNYYIWSPLYFQEQIDVAKWSWTHDRASLLNLFGLNGFWGWRPEYFHYYDAYSNPILIAFTFVPFLLATVALLFKSSKSRLNAYLMLSILAFIFLAKGLHEPFSQLNLLLYTYIPSMEMFREPVSKFTMAIMPFLALLIGYAVDHIANLKISKIIPTRFTKTFIATFFICTFVVTAFPLVANPIETKTQQVPFSSYVQIPNYWNQATDWLNNQTGEFKILVTPADDFYQMPYNWGYYGTDSFLERLIQKPIISNHYVYSYKENPDIVVTFQQLYSTIRYNRTNEFKAFLDLLNIKYILQRNDIQHNFTGRNIIPPSEMQNFLAQQPYISLIQRFGQLDIYECTEPKPYIYIVNPPTLQQTIIKIENITTLEHTWNFNSPTELEEWQNTTLKIHWQALQQLSLDNGTLKTELWNSTWGWKTINSPILPAQYGDTYQIQADVKGQNAHQVHVKIAECDENKKIITATYAAYVNDGTFDWTHITFNYELTNKTTEYLQMQVWHGHETDKPFPNVIWIDNVQIQGYITILNTTGLDLIFPNTTQNQPATIISYEKINPTKITATVNATQPFILAISEALDQSWTAYVNGTQIKPTSLYLCITGFQINQTGLLDITIEYEPQKWFFYGSIISLSTFLVCTVYLAYSYTKTKTILHKLKQKLTHHRNN